MLNIPLFRTLGLSTLTFVVAGWLISRYAGAPAITILIDRSYCPASQWQQVIQRYAELYQQHQHKSRRIENVILFNDVSEEVQTVLRPEDLQMLQTYGSFSLERQTNLQKNYSHSQVLRCS
ncbi:hypothetical protein ACQ4M5_13140 [Leptolyngbya sp. AN10]